MSRAHILIIGVIILVVICSLSLAIRRLELHRHESELRVAVQRYLEVTTTVEGISDPNIMAQVASGERLRELMRYRCDGCPSAQEATGIEIRTLEVLEYGQGQSKVRVHYEEGWHQVDAKTGRPIGKCHVQVFTIILVLSQEDGIWKISDIEEFIPEIISQVEFRTLNEKYCPTE